MKKIYRAPNICSVDEIQGIVPLAVAAAGITTVATQLAPALAMVGLYAAARGVKQAMEARPALSSNSFAGVVE